MRFAAQRTLELQGFLPAQTGSAGLPYTVSSKLISDAIDKWEKARGLSVGHRLRPSYWKEANAAKELKKKQLEEERVKKDKTPTVGSVKKPRAPLSPEAKDRSKEARRKYKLLNKDKIREEKRLAAQRRRDAMTPEQKKAESKRIQAYNKARLERQRAEKQRLSQNT